MSFAPTHPSLRHPIRRPVSQTLFGALRTWFYAPPARPRLDPRTLPDHLKRDMGLLDGNDPAGRHC